MTKPRTDILHVRLTDAERERLHVAAEGSHLRDSTWARQAILRALEHWEERQRLKAVAERKRGDRG